VDKAPRQQSGVLKPLSPKYSESSSAILITDGRPYEAPTRGCGDGDAAPGQ
jgi:hypothetical protein